MKENTPVGGVFFFFEHGYTGFSTSLSLSRGFPKEDIMTFVALRLKKNTLYDIIEYIKKKAVDLP